MPRARGGSEECDPPHRFVLSHGIERQDLHVIEATLEADGDQTVVVIVEKGMPLSHVADYGAGIQIHVEDLGAHLAGRDPEGDTEARWKALADHYRPLADEIG